MKKSQILAAIALAFVLGIVAPVAGVAQNASAFTVADNTTFGKASCDEVNKMVAGLKADSKMYSYEANAFELAAKYAAGTDAAKNATIDSQGDAINGSMISIATDGYTYTGVALTNGANTPDQVRDMIASAKETSATVTKDGQTVRYNAYNLFSGIISGIKNKATDGGSSLKNALNSAYVTTGNAIFDWANQRNINQYISLTNNPLTTLAEFSKFVTLTEQIEDAETALQNYDAAIAELKNAVSVDDKVILTTAGVAQYDSIFNTEDYAPKVVDVVYLINNGGGDWIKDRSNWNSVYNAVKTAGNGNCSAANNERQNYSNMMAVANAYIIATWDRFAGKDDFEVAEYLMGIQTPTDPDQPTDPSTPDEAVNTTLIDGNVTVSGKFHSNVILKAVKSDKEYTALKDLKNYIYDITLTRNGQPYKFEGEATVTINLPEGFDGTKSNLYYINDEGKFEKFPVTYNAEAKTLTFKTTHFSLYAIVEGEVAKADLVAPGTGILGSANGNASTTVSIVAGLATALTALGAGVVAYRNARRSSEK